MKFERSGILIAGLGLLISYASFGAGGAGGSSSAGTGANDFERNVCRIRSSQNGSFQGQVFKTVSGFAVQAPSEISHPLDSSENTEQLLVQSKITEVPYPKAAWGSIGLPAWIVVLHDHRGGRLAEQELGPRSVTYVLEGPFCEGLLDTRDAGLAVELTELADRNDSWVERNPPPRHSYYE